MGAGTRGSAKPAPITSTLTADVSAAPPFHAKRGERANPIMGVSPGGARLSSPQAGGREGLKVQPWFASRPGPRRSASSGRLRGPCLSLRFTQRFRPPPGELAGGRQFPCLSVTHPPLALWPPSRPVPQPAPRHTARPRHRDSPPARRAANGARGRSRLRRCSTPRPQPRILRIRTDLQPPRAASRGTSRRAKSSIFACAPETSVRSGAALLPASPSGLPRSARTSWRSLRAPRGVGIRPRRNTRHNSHWLIV